VTKCPKCDDEMEKRYTRIEDHPGYEVVEREAVDDEGNVSTYEVELVDGEDLTPHIRMNNTWAAHGYKGKPWWCATCGVIRFTEA